MTNRRRHFANLAVFAFNQFQSNPAIRNTFAETDWRNARRDCVVSALCADCFEPQARRYNLRLRLQNPRAARQSFATLNYNSVFQPLQIFQRWNFFDLRPILAFVRILRMQKFFIPFCLVAQKQKSFRIRVEPANRINVLLETKIRQRAVGRAVAGELRQYAVRFVEGNQHNNFLTAKSPRTQRKIVYLGVLASWRLNSSRDP